MEAVGNNKTGIQNYGKGLVTSLKMLVPGLSTYTLGNIDLKHDNLKDDVVELSKGKNAKCEKEKVSDSFFQGLLYTIKRTVPFLSSYTVGQDKIEHENLKQDVADLKDGIQVSEHKKAGFFKTVGTGMIEKIKMHLPIYGTYYKGKMINETEALEKTVEEIQDDKDTDKAE